MKKIELDNSRESRTKEAVIKEARYYNYNYYCIIHSVSLLGIMQIHKHTSKGTGN